MHARSKYQSPDEVIVSEASFAVTPSIKRFGAGAMTWIPETKDKGGIIDLRVAIFEADDNKLKKLISLDKLKELSEELNSLSTNAIVQIQKEMRDARFIFSNKDDVRGVSSLVLGVFKDKISQELKEIEAQGSDLERRGYLQKILHDERILNIDNIIRAGVPDSTNGALNIAKKKIIKDSSFSDRIKKEQKRKDMIR